MRSSTRYASGASPSPEAAVEETVTPMQLAEDAALAEIVAFAQQPLDLDDEPTPEAEAAAVIAAAELDPNIAAALDAIRETYGKTQESIRDVLVAAAATRGHALAQDDNASLVAAALAVMEKFATRPEPRQPDIHVHTPQQDLRVNVEQPKFEPQITVEGTTVEVPEREVRVDVRVPEQDAPVVNVQPAEPQVVVQAAAPPVVNMTVPDEIRMVPVETETVAERDDDDLIVRSVTRPTGG